MCIRDRGELDQCWPQTAMHVRNLALNQLADENVGTLANRLRSAEDLFPFRMAPPAAPDATADNPLCEIWEESRERLGGRLRDVQQMRALPCDSRNLGIQYSG